MMEHFKEILQNILSAVVISPSDSDSDRALKIIWYAFFGSIIVLVIISWLLFVMLTFTNENVKVPYIENDTLYTALGKLSDRGLVANAAPKYTDEYDTGVVYRQSPNQGSIVKQGRTVTFNVSLGPRKSALPDFRGFTRFELMDYLNETYPDIEELPYDFNAPLYEFNDEIEKGRIIKQEPPESTPIQNVKKVTFWFSNGPADYSAPVLANYVGRNLDEVSEELAELEIYYGYDFCSNPRSSFRHAYSRTVHR
jgi:beta-lactam-binding protein with PASTA domain